MPMAITIEGTAFPLGKINKNGWGIPFSEADNIISSLKNSVLRICPRDAPVKAGLLSPFWPDYFFPPSDTKFT